MPPDFNRNVHCLLGLPFDAVDMDQAEQKIRAAIDSRTRCFLSTPNLNFLMACRTDAEFRQSVLISDLVVADGMPLIWLARLLGLPIRHRVAGASLFERLRSMPVAKPIRVYFFGGPDGAAEAASNKINGEGRGMQCVGFMSPGFGSVADMSSPSIIETINKSEADFLVVSLGARKGQAWITHNLTVLNVPVISHLGAVVNFVAGSVKRAPSWVQNLGLEWLWRIKEEPQLWRRYFDDGKGLIRVLNTKILPNIWTVKDSSVGHTETRPQAALQISKTEKKIVVTLTGNWRHENLKPLQNTLSQIAMSHRADMVLAMNDVTQIDDSFLGICLLLSGHQKSIDQMLVFEGLSPKIKETFAQSAVEYLWQSSH